MRSLMYLLGCYWLLGMIKRSKAVEIAVDTDVFIKQTRKEIISIYCLEGNCSCVFSNVQLVVVNSRHDRPYSDTRLILGIELFFKLLRGCTRRNILDSKC